MNAKDISKKLTSQGYVKYNLRLSNFVSDTESMNKVQMYFSSLPVDPYSLGNRYREYTQFRFSPKLEFGIYEEYSQSKEYNPVTGGIIREYPQISHEIINTTLVQDIIKHDNEIVEQIKDFPKVEDMMCGVHFFRYKATENSPAYSSPSWLHRDDEDIVFVHLINISENIIGGDNIIASSKENIECVLRLNKPLDTFIVNHLKLHAVTPMSMSDEEQSNDFVFRDIILVTFQKRI